MIGSEVHRPGGWEYDLYVIEKDGERGRNRTFNLLIKSQLLCQLSYAPGCEEKLRKTKENYSRAIGDCFRCRGQEWCSLLATPAQVVASKLSRSSEHMPGIISTSAIAKGFLLDGQWINDGAVAEIRSPYDQRVVGAVAVATRTHAEQAIAAAIRAFEITRRMPAFDRQQILREIAPSIEQRREEFARSIC